MSKPNKKRYKLSTVVAEAREKHPQIEIETDDGQVFKVDPPQFWSDEAADPKVGPRETMISILGEDQYEKYKAAGGSYASLNLVIEAWAQDQGADLGKSSASTGS